MTDVQISVEQMLAASLFTLTQLLNGATEKVADLEGRNENQKYKLGVERDQRERLQADLDKEIIFWKETAATAGETIREQAGEIARLAAELESTRNALDIRGRTIDHQADQIRKLQRELDEARQSKRTPKMGDRVRIKPNARYISLMGNVVLHSAKGNDTDGFVGVITSLDAERDISVSESSDAEWGWRVLPEDVEVLS